MDSCRFRGLWGRIQHLFGGIVHFLVSHDILRGYVLNNAGPIRAATKSPETKKSESEEDDTKCEAKESCEDSDGCLV